MDQSELDSKYFIDEYVYNCPFCNRRNVRYTVPTAGSFDWSNDRDCYYFVARCSSCEKRSIHLSFEDMAEYSGSGYRLYPPEGGEGTPVKTIDELIIYSRPTSFFTIDSSIPKVVRDLIFEAEQALQFNLHTGASASLRKAIYKLVKHEKVIVLNEKSGLTDYAGSIKALKDKFPFVTPELFDAIAEVQGLASNSVHEDEWEAWDSKSLRFLIELSKSVLSEMYVYPMKRKQNHAKLSELKKNVTGGK